MIEVENLQKTFHARQNRPGILGALRSLVKPDFYALDALKGLSFQLSPGECVAFIGPNGAGKSTTLKILSGILHPSGGTARVNGIVPWKQRKELARHIGTVFGQRSQMWYHLPARDTFELLGSAYDLDRPTYLRRLDELVSGFEIGDIIDKPVRQLSLGQRMRCEIVASFLHKPSVLFLDEPTVGLDVAAKAIIRNLVRRAAAEDGTTVLLTSHDTGDMEQVCDRVMVIHHGGLLIDTEVAGLRAQYIRRKRITFLTKEERIEMPLPGVTMLEQTPHKSVLQVDTAAQDVEAVIQQAMGQSALRDITVEDPPMDDVIQAIYAGQRPGAIPGAIRDRESA